MIASGAVTVIGQLNASASAPHAGSRRLRPWGSARRLAASVVSPQVDVALTGGSVSAASISLVSRLNAKDDGTAIRTDASGNALPTAEATAQAVGGGVAGAGSGASATATDAGIAALTVGESARLVATGDVRLLAVSYSDARARTSAISGAAASGGASLATAIANGSTRVTMGGEVGTAAGGSGAANLTIAASSTARADADAEAIVAGAAVAAGVAQADATVGRTVAVAVGPAAELDVTGALTVEASADNRADARTGGATAGAVSASAMLPTAKVSGSTGVAVRRRRDRRRQRDAAVGGVRTSPTPRRRCSTCRSRAELGPRRSPR